MNFDSRTSGRILEIRQHLEFLFSERGFDVVNAQDFNFMDTWYIVLGSESFNLKFYTERGALECYIGTKHTQHNHVAYSGNVDINKQEMDKVWFFLMGNHPLSVIDYLTGAKQDLSYLQKPVKLTIPSQHLPEIAAALIEHFDKLAALFAVDGFQGRARTMASFFQPREDDFRKTYPRKI